MISEFFRTKPTQQIERPRDVREFDLARENQRRVVAEVDAASDVLSALVRNMKGPMPTTRKGAT